MQTGTRTGASSRATRRRARLARVGALLGACAASACGAGGGGGGGGSGDPGSGSAGPRTGALSIAGTAAPTADECKTLYGNYKAFAPEVTLDEASFVERCRWAERVVLGCVDETRKACAKGGPGDTACVSVGVPSCVQRYRTLAARKAGIIERIANSVLDGVFATGPGGVLDLSGDFASSALGQRAYAAFLPGRRAWVLFPFWRGKCRNVRGYLWSSVPFADTDLERGSSGADTLPAFDVALEDPCGKGPVPASAPATAAAKTAAPKTARGAPATAAPRVYLSEPFVIEERIDPQWLLVSWTWD